LPLAIYYFDFDFFRRLSFFAIFIDFLSAFSFAISMLRFSLILMTFSFRLQSFFRRFRRFRAMPPFSSFDAAADVFDFSLYFSMPPFAAISTPLRPPITHIAYAAISFIFISITPYYAFDDYIIMIIDY
jgi:hypothetical protein